MAGDKYKVNARFYENDPSGKVRCTLCPHRCLISENTDSICGTRILENGILKAVNYGFVVSASIDPIEKKPLYHFHPGTPTLSFGSLGCNMSCPHCQNASISCPKISQLTENEIQDTTGGTLWTPEAVIEAGINRKADGVSFTYNEPTIWHEWALDVSKLAKKNGLYTVYVTNAYIEKGPLDEIGPYLDAYAADLKGWGDDFYRKFSKINDWEKILTAIDRAKNVHGMHVEVTTNIVPGYNDDEDTLKNISQWIFKNLGELTVWHVSRFIPHHKLDHLEPTPVETLLKAKEIGHEIGLKHIFLGNVHGLPDVENTSCPGCGEILVKRTGYSTNLTNLDGNKCSACGAESGIVI